NHRERGGVGADRHDGARSERDAPAKPHEHDERGSDQRGKNGDGEHIFRIAAEPQPGADKEENESRRRKARKSEPLLSHDRALFPETVLPAATSAQRKAE